MRVVTMTAAAVAAVTAMCGAGTASAEASVSSEATSVGQTAAETGTVQTQPVDIVSAPTLIAHTAAGDFAYRTVGRGSPILLITGYGASMDSWAPSFVDALAAHHTVVVFDNAGVGESSAVPEPSISAMAEQTSALISTLRLGRPAVLGWSMGGMIAQALAVLHPGQVGRLVLAATQAGTGHSLPIPPAAAAALDSPNPAVVLSVLFPSDQLAATKAYAEGIIEYPGFYAAPTAVKAVQNLAIQQWMAGGDPAGRRVGEIRVPTLVADGTEDALDPVANDFLLARDVHRAKLALYPDAGHAFLFQDSATFVPVIERFVR